MNKINEISHPPLFNRKTFGCPYCNTYNPQQWYNIYGREHFSEIFYKKKINKEHIFSSYDENSPKISTFFPAIHVTKCQNCNKITIWVYDKIVFPVKYGNPPNPDLPEDVKNYYNEASEIFEKSPRGAAALLRLAVQKLCVHLGGKGHKLDDDIALLVKKGLDKRIQKALDIVRVIGNEAVHPGVINLNDNKKVVTSLFLLVNLIAEKMISEPKHIDKIYTSLPSEKLEAIKQRDKKYSCSHTPNITKKMA